VFAFDEETAPEGRPEVWVISHCLSLLRTGLKLAARSARVFSMSFGYG